MIRNSQGWRKPLFALIIATVCSGLLAHSPDVAAKPTWKSTGGEKVRGQRQGRKKQTITESPVAEEPVIQEPVVQEPAVNEAPVIAGSPDSSITESAFYDFQPLATDPEGKALTFSVVNKPHWADFDPTTGALYGTPDSQDIGLYSSIEISVTDDGQSTAALPIFAINVLAASMQSATLNWQPPTENTDQSALLNLAGYKIYYENGNGQFIELVDLSNPGLTSYVVPDLTVGVWSFAMTAYNLDGMESAYSNLSQINLSLQ